MFYIKNVFRTLTAVNNFGWKLDHICFKGPRIRIENLSVVASEIETSHLVSISSTWLGWYIIFRLYLESFQIQEKRQISKFGIHMHFTVWLGKIKMLRTSKLAHANWFWKSRIYIAVFAVSSWKLQSWKLKNHW